jgi:cation diffusion facilitator family transporter
VDQQKRKTSVALLSVVSNTILVLLKLMVGLSTGAVSIISESIHSGVDLLASLIAWFAVRTSGQPADEDHPFGHGKYENISGTVEALLIFLAAGWIVYEAVKKLMHPEPLEHVGLGAIIMLISAVVNIIVSQKLFKVGKETDSMALRADAWHLRTDVYTSAGVMVGLIFLWLNDVIAPQVDLHWIDPVAAILVALLIVRAAYILTVQSARDLLDASLPRDEEEWIRQRICQWTPVVRGFHRLRTRKSGAHRFVQFHLLVDGSMSVDESHRINDEIVLAIKNQYPGSMVVIHLEPCSLPCTTECLHDCLLNEEHRKSISLERNGVA